MSFLLQSIWAAEWQRKALKVAKEMGATVVQDSIEWHGTLEERRAKSLEYFAKIGIEVTQ